MTEDQAFVANFQGKIEDSLRSNRQLRGVLIGFGVLCLLLMGLLLSSTGGRGAAVICIVGWTLYMSIFIGLSYSILGNMNASIQEVDDPRLVGVLAMCSMQGDSTVSNTANKALLRLLPSVQAEHAPCFTPEQRSALLALMRKDRPDLVIPILQVLQKIGDTQALPIVKQLGEEPGAIVGYGVLFRQRAQIRDAANQCLPHLENCAEQERLRRTLVRSSDSPTENTYLRPASHNKVPTEQLLHPIDHSPD